MNPWYLAGGAAILYFLARGSELELNFGGGDVGTDLPPINPRYAVSRTHPYGLWRTRRPPGLPSNARRASAPGGALPYIKTMAAYYQQGPAFIDAMVKLAQAESNATMAAPARNFDARCKSGYRPDSQRLCLTSEGRRGSNDTLITAWGAFQWNRDALRNLTTPWSLTPNALPASYGTKFPHELSPREELGIPIRFYAKLWNRVRSAGGSALDARRAIELWHKKPDEAKAFLRNGERDGFGNAWRQVSSYYAGAVDRRVRA